MKRRSKKLLWGIPAAIALASIFLALFTDFRRPQAQKEDYSRISSTEYDTVFLSMFPLDNFREEAFSHYFSQTLFKSSYCIPDMPVMEQYMKRIAKSGNVIGTVYLGIRPDCTDMERLQAMILRYPSVNFEILLACPSAAYWTALSQEDYSRVLESYRSFLIAILDAPRTRCYCMADQEWLINNPANYEDQWLTTEFVSTNLATHMNPEYAYLTTAKNLASLCDSLTEVTEKLRTDPETFPDLSDLCILFFGDSVVANFESSLSIPGVVEGLSGAAVYNCGYGGNSAAMPEPDAIGLPSILDAFFRRDPSALPEDIPAYKGISSYLADPPEDKELCFLINYGLNDYFNGYEVSSGDPYDVSAYCGAVRTAVRTIRENVPDARIVLCTPNFVDIFDAGTEPHGVSGNVLTDYVEALADLSRELQTDLLDNYHDLGINKDNQTEYLQDGVHPGISCRYLIGKRICHLLAP